MPRETIASVKKALKAEIKKVERDRDDWALRHSVLSEDFDKKVGRNEHLEKENRENARRITIFQAESEKLRTRIAELEAEIVKLHASAPAAYSRPFSA